MRALVLLVVSLLAFGGLAGCIGAGKETPPTVGPASTGGDDPLTPNSTGGLTSQLTVLAPLTSTVTLDAPAWIASGTEVPVKVAAPANAKGTTTYAWAVGPRPETVAVTAVNMDTGSAKNGADWIQPGASKALTFSTSGVYALHCHPHPAMRHNVTVIDGYASAKSVEVAIADGAGLAEYRFVPENIVIGTGTTVVYKNVGKQPHTATSLGAQEPALKALPLKTESGTVKLEGDGWLRVLAILKDSEGRLGLASQDIYVTPTLPAFETKTVTVEFSYASPAPLAGTPAQAAPENIPFVLEQGGLVTINYTFADAAGSSPAAQNLAEVELHLKKDGDTQDTMTADPAASGSLAGKAIAGAYTLTIVPVQGAQLTGTVVIEVVYELVPPAPSPPAGAGDDHGGPSHAH